MKYTLISTIDNTTEYCYGLTKEECERKKKKLEKVNWVCEIVPTNINGGGF